MTSVFKPRTLILFIGDIAFFTLALFVSLSVRLILPILPPSEAAHSLLELFRIHLEPFAILFIVWIIVFFIAGLYESRSIILERRAISTALLVAQTCNVVLAALF